MNPNRQNSDNNGLNSQNPMIGNSLGTLNQTGQTLGSSPLGQTPNMTVPNPVPMPNMQPNVTPNPTEVPINPQNPVPNPTPVVSPTPAVQQGQTSALESNPGVNNNSTPIATPIPGTDGTPGVNNSLIGSTVGNSVSLSNGNLNGFNNFKQDSIGTVPPPENKQKKPKKEKKPMNKIVFTILIIVLIILIAVGVYFLLSLGKVKLNTKTVNLGIGEMVPGKITDYVNIVKGDANECNLDTNSVKTDKIGQYEVHITCGKDVYTSKVIVTDKEPPKLSLKVLFASVGDAVTSEDFVKSCEDSSNCQTSFANEEEVTTSLNNAGTHKIKITATDDNNNSTTYETYLFVTEKPTTVYMNCTSSKSEDIEGYKVKKNINDVIPIGRSSDASDFNYYYAGVSLREITYTFEESEEYEEIAKGKEAVITFDNNTGVAEYDDEKLTIKIITDLPKSTLDSENNGAFPTAFTEIVALYNNPEKGYTWSNKSSYPAK